MVDTEAFKTELAATLRTAALKKIGRLDWSYREVAEEAGIPLVIARDILESHRWTLEQAITMAELTGVMVAAV